MAHPEQIEFCKKVMSQFNLSNSRVYDFGSLDINGNNRYLFKSGVGVGAEYTGIDIGEGSNVDVVCPAHLFKPPKKADIVISTEMLEHDRHWAESIKNMLYCLSSGGLFIMTCATEGRLEHGTINSNDSGSSPFTTDYYRNIGKEEFEKEVGLDNFKTYETTINIVHKDLQFWGIKK